MEATTVAAGAMGAMAETECHELKPFTVHAKHPRLGHRAEIMQQRRRPIAAFAHSRYLARLAAASEIIINVRVTYG